MFLESLNVCVGLYSCEYQTKLIHVVPTRLIYLEEKHSEIDVWELINENTSKIKLHQNVMFDNSPDWAAWIRLLYEKSAPDSADKCMFVQYCIIICL